MPRGLWLAAALLAFGGCSALTPNPEYGNQPAYPTASYPPPEYPPGVYPPSPYDPNAAAYPGYDYSGDAPTIIEEGAPVPLVLLGGEWGFYDHERHWHRAPDDVRRRFEEHRDAGPQFRPDGQRFDGRRLDGRRFDEGYGQPRPEGRPMPFGEHPGAPTGGFPGFRPNEPARPLPPLATPARPAPAGAPAAMFPGFRPNEPARLQAPPATPVRPAPIGAPAAMFPGFRPNEPARP